MKKERLDLLLVGRGLVSSREKAKALIMSGRVLVDGQREEKAGTLVFADKEIRIKGGEDKFVSRGGYKLLKAVSVFGIDLKGKTCLDIGASTGGFTDCMLQHGAKKVYSIDVGYGQLDWKIRQDERVVVLEKTNVRYLTGDQVPELADFASIDVSFISLTKIIEAVQARLKYRAELVCLIKPQFEAGRDKVGKKGVVREKSVHCQVIEFIIGAMQARHFHILGLDFSPIKGPAGNIEYLLYMRNKKTGEGDGQDQIRKLDKDQVEAEVPLEIEELVNKSHEMVV